MEDYTCCIRTEPDYQDAFFNRSGIHRLKNNLKAAIEDISKAIKLQPCNLDFLNNRLIYYREIGDFEKYVPSNLLK